MIRSRQSFVIIDYYYYVIKMFTPLKTLTLSVLLITFVACSSGEKNAICDLQIREYAEKMLQCLKNEFPRGADFTEFDKIMRKADFIRLRHQPFAITKDSPHYEYHRRDVAGQTKAGDTFFVTVYGTEIGEITAPFRN